jgi:hypothetical protein
MDGRSQTGAFVYHVYGGMDGLHVTGVFGLERDLEVLAFELGC